MSLSDIKVSKNYSVDKIYTDLSVPLLPLKDLVLLPNLIVCVLVGRDNSIKAIERASKLDSKIFVCTQKDSTVEDIILDDLYGYGVMAEIVEYFILPDNTYKITLRGLDIRKLQSVYQDDLDGWSVFVEMHEAKILIEDENERQALQGVVLDQFEQLCKIKKIYDPELIAYLKNLDDSFNLVYNIISKIDLKISEKEKFLCELSENILLKNLNEHIISDMNILDIKRRINNRVKSQVEKNQKEYYINEQIKALQKELGTSDEEDELSDMLEQIKTKPLSAHAKETALTEYKKLKNMNQFSAENSMIKNYLSFLISLPWGIVSKTTKNLDNIKTSLSVSHYGMQEVKDRIYELIVQYNKVKSSELRKSPILCFYGAPGIGKTSIAYAIGEALGLETISIALGGVRDESVLRGHRRTYIGAMPGKIVQAIKDAKSSNLVIILDEIGSIGNDWRGNPEDALLEILDPIQNKYFQDNYLGTGFDLSGIIFVATTNTVDNLKPALLDRLEVIKLSGYTQEEKNAIAFDYLIPKLLKEYGLKDSELKIDSEAVDEIIRFYTYEVGVRGLNKQLSKIIRKVMCTIEEKKEKEVIITKDNVKTFLKKPVYFDSYKDRMDRVGCVTGLAYLQGREGQEGELLSIESMLLPGEGKIEYTGNLKDMIKESIQIAYKLLFSKAYKYNIDASFFKEKNLYLNFPSGGVPKDGPSAGVAIFCSLFSTFKNIPFPSNVAMTGEISLYDVLKVGGIKEKLLAAYRHGIKKIFIPHDNEIDLQDLDKKILDDMEIIPIKTVDEVLVNLKLI